MDSDFYRKFRNTINLILGIYDASEGKRILDLDELTIKTSKLSGIGYSLKNFTESQSLILTGWSADEYIFPNGTIVLKSYFSYYDKKDPNTTLYIQQVTLTTNYEEKPQANIVYESKEKDISQLLIPNDSIDSNFSHKDILIQKTKIHIGDYDACFQSFSRINCESYIEENYPLLLETYQHLSPTLYKNSLLELGKDDELQVIYNYNSPVYCQFTNNKKLQEFGLDPNSFDDVNKVTELIEGELDFYIGTIKDFVEGQERKYRDSTKRKEKLKK